MAYYPEEPHLPTRLEIYNRAVELKNKKLEELGLPTYKLAASEREIDSKVEMELEEENLLYKAKLDLMTGYSEDLEKYKHELLKHLEEIKEGLDATVKELRELGVEPPEWTLPRPELEERVVRLSRQLDETKEELYRAREAKRKAEKLAEEATKTVKELQEKLRVPPVPPKPPEVKPPAPPKPPEVKPPPAPPVKVLPPVPEVCAIDGTPITEVTRVPIGPVPVRLSPDEEYMRTRLGLPIPEREIVWLDVPPTMKLFACQQDHLFERDPVTGRLVERTPEYVYRKILRETAALRRITYPEVGAPPIPYPRIPGVPRAKYPSFPFGVFRVQDAFAGWLKMVKRISETEFAMLSDEERKRLIDEFMEWMRH